MVSQSDLDLTSECRYTALGLGQFCGKFSVAAIQIKIEVTRTERRWLALPSIDPRIIWTAIVISILLHVMSWIGASWVHHPLLATKDSGVKIRTLTPGEKRLLDNMKNNVENANRVIETQQTETDAPKKNTSLGAQDHSTDRETRLKPNILTNSRALDAGQSPSTPSTHSVSKPPSSLDRPTTQGIKPMVAPQIFTGPGTLSIGARKAKPRTNYEKLLPDKTDDVFRKTGGGYVEPLDASIPASDHIDMNTTSFRYISYFTGLRKQIEMVWIYPAEAARRGLQGAVQLEMVIEKDGQVSKVRIVQSSGYSTLDENMMKTIKLASPFAPLPKNWGKQRLVVTGSFHYILTYASH